MRTSPDHDKICERCLCSGGVVHEVGPSYDIVKKEWTVLSFELRSCPLYCREKAIHRWQKYRRRFPYITKKSSIPPKCHLFLEHFLLEE